MEEDLLRLEWLVAGVTVVVAGLVVGGVDTETVVVADVLCVDEVVAVTVAVVVAVTLVLLAVNGLVVLAGVVLVEVVVLATAGLSGLDWALAPSIHGFGVAPRNLFAVELDDSTSYEANMAAVEAEVAAAPVAGTTSGRHGRGCRART
jgi:hypothetical protein